MPCFHVIEGPVGAGKTTFANKLGQELRTPPLILDAWFVTLFRSDRPDRDLWEWYAARKQRCIDQITDVAQGLLGTDHDAIVELGLLQRESRKNYYARLNDIGAAYVVYVLDAPMPERLARVRKRNIEKGESYAMEVTDAIFATASEMWEPPDAAECVGRDIRFVDIP